VPEPDSRPDLAGNVVFLAFAAAGAARKLASIGAMLGGAVAGVQLLAMNRALSDGR